MDRFGPRTTCGPLHLSSNYPLIVFYLWTHAAEGGMLMVTETATKGIVERRQNQRFRVKAGAFAAVRPYLIDQNPMGPVVDVSEGGLSFSYHANGEISYESTELDLCSKNDGIYVGRIPVKTVSDLEINDQDAMGPEGERRRGVQFGPLSEEQLYQLRYFIQKCTSDEV
jgi:hypothetical protein